MLFLRLMTGAFRAQVEVNLAPSSFCPTARAILASIKVKHPMVNCLERLVLLALCLLALTASSAAQELKRIRIGYPSLSTTQGHIWVGQEQGLFRKYGLDVEPILLRGGQLATQALATGDPPLVNIGTVVPAGLQGYKLGLISP